METQQQSALANEWAEIKAAQQDPAMFRPLYERYYTPIFRFVFRRTADESLAADICSQVFLKAMQHLPGYEFKGAPFSAWLYRVASNELVQHFRHTSRRRVVVAEDRHLAGLVDEMQEGRGTQQRDALVGALDCLKINELELIELRFFEQLPFKQIAEIYDVPEANIKMRTYRILDKLKKILKEKYNVH
jgi:RNA polymerase sigma-70 factor (ECF subfamily)